jgi:addiction module RelE/StbE family toxin
MIITYSSQFHKLVRKYSQYKDIIIKKTLLFKENPFEPSLRTHKLSGSLEGYYAFSVNYSLRIVFRFIDNDKVFFVVIGTHSVYR